MAGFTLLDWLLIATGLLAVAAGWRRSRYDGIPPRIWWRQERMHRRPGAIFGRLAKVVLGAAVLVAAFVAAVLAAGALVLGAVAVGVAVWVWWRLRRAAAACIPRIFPVERIDGALAEPPPTTHPTTGLNQAHPSHMITEV